MSRIGYIRVSTLEQNTIRQEVLMKELGVDKIYIDKCSGKDMDRPRLKDMLDFIREGDVVIVESFSRLSRNTKELLEMVEFMNKKGVQFISKKEAVDTSTPQGKFMLTVFAAMAELERENILERQREGIAAAKAEGKYKGRKPVEVGDMFFVVTKMWVNDEISLSEAQKRLGMASATFFRKCKQYGIKKARA
jgi:DNA invertase Pin-like site-specific DNA recombinase